MTTTVSITETLPNIKGYKSVEEQWKSKYEELVSNIGTKDGLTILVASSKDYHRLRLWLIYQTRNMESLDNDQQSKIKTLNDRFNAEHSLNLPIEVTTQKPFASWYLKYKEMKREYAKMGKVKAIRQRDKERICLAKWIAKQRVAMRDETLAPWQMTLLREAGLKPSIKLKHKIKQENEVKWNEYYELLKIFQEKHGHCAVPEHVNSSLSFWVTYQRTAFVRKLLRTDRKEKLDKLGFCWERSNERQLM